MHEFTRKVVCLSGTLGFSIVCRASPPTRETGFSSEVSLPGYAPLRHCSSCVVQTFSLYICRVLMQRIYLSEHRACRVSALESPPPSRHDTAQRGREERFSRLERGSNGDGGSTLSGRVLPRSDGFRRTTGRLPRPLSLYPSRRSSRGFVRRPGRTDVRRFVTYRHHLSQSYLFYRLLLKVILLRQPACSFLGSSPDAERLPAQHFSHLFTNA